MWWSQNNFLVIKVCPKGRKVKGKGLPKQKTLNRILWMVIPLVSIQWYNLQRKKAISIIKSPIADFI
jgi:hypothetical protein